MLPWLIAGWILFGPRLKAAARPPSTSAPPPPQAPPLVAYIYQLPDDAFETVRMAIAEQPGGTPREMGIFSSEANALKVVQENGWALAWPGVQQLKERPQ